MVNSILIEGGHKVVCKVLNREIFLAKRNSVSNLLNVKAAREGDAEAKSPATASSTTSTAMILLRQRQ